jgi:superfamily I DNA/RNA helicase
MARDDFSTNDFHVLTSFVRSIQSKTIFVNAIDKIKLSLYTILNKNFLQRKSSDKMQEEANMTTFTPTKQQEAVITFFEAKYGPEQRNKLVSLFLNAVAGAGKTSTLMLVAEAVKRLGLNIEGCMVAFNKIIATAAQNKLKDMGSSLKAKTTNALGHGILLEAAKSGECPKIKLEARKYNDLVSNYVFARKYSFTAGKIPPKLISSINKLVSAARLTFIEPTEDNLLEIVDHYGLEINMVYWSFIWQAVKPLIEEGVNAFLATGEIDYDDQIYLPLRLNYISPKYDLMMIDEAQDLNSVRLKLIQASIKPDGLLLFVGDPFQAIQGFAFADTHSVQTIKSATHAAELPLSVCWRCDANIIKVAQAIVPHIQARPGAPDGIVDLISGSLLVKALQPGSKRSGVVKDPDLVLCRINAELVAYCLECIRQGKYAVIRGRSIGRGILAKIDEIIEKANKSITVQNLSEAANEWLQSQVKALWGKKNAEEKIAKLTDQINSIEAFVTGFLLDCPNGTIDQLRQYIEEKFSGDEDENGDEKDGVLPIVFSTVHKAKGLEFDRVFILKPDLMPHPMAKLDWQVEQEYNILYVACTRAKHELYFVDSIPDCLKHVILPAEEEEKESEPVTAEPEIPILGSLPASAAQEPEEAPAQPTCAPAKGKSTGRPRKNTVHQDITLDREALAEFDALPSEMEYTLSAYLQELMARDRANGWTVAKEVKARQPKRPASPKKAPKPEPDPDGDGGQPLPPTELDLVEEEEVGDLVATSVASSVVGEVEPAAPAAITERRLFFQCKSVISPYGEPTKTCNHRWGHDYFYDPATRESWRFDPETGERRTPDMDRQPCPKCGRKYVKILNKGRNIRTKHNESVKCTHSCKNASSAECECVCGGSCHGENLIKGIKLFKGALKDAVAKIQRDYSPT